MDKWYASLGSIVQKLLVSYALVVSYPQHCQIRTNVNYWYAIIISTNMLVFTFSVAELQIILISY